MGLYNKYILPKLINCACAVGPVSKQRAKVVPLAQGKVLEIGIGGGLNLPFYNPSSVEQVLGLDPSAELLATIRPRLSQGPFEVKLLHAAAEAIPLADYSVDTVLITYTLCSISDVGLALSEMKRVLKPDGQLLFCEHGAAPDPAVLQWQNRINPLWKMFGGGCNLNRRIPDLIEEGGFKINDLQTMYIPGWKPACFNYWGKANII